MAKVNLTLVPEQRATAATFLAYDRLGFAARYLNLWDEIRSLRARKVPADMAFRWYSDSGIEERTTDDWDNPLKFVTAGDLAALKLPDNLLPWDRAIFAFLKAVPPNTRVVLWWH